MPTDFTPVPALVGGALIGLAATWLLAALGRIAGISGIVNGLVEGAPEGRGWRLAFVLAMVAAAGAWFAFTGTPARSGFPLQWVLVAGLLLFDLLLVVASLLFVTGLLLVAGLLPVDPLLVLAGLRSGLLVFLVLARARLGAGAAGQNSGGYRSPTPMRPPRRMPDIEKRSLSSRAALTANQSF